MAVQLLAALVGAFTDRFRATVPTAARVHPNSAWPPSPGQAPTGSPVISRRFPAAPEQVKAARNFVAELLGDDHPLRDDAMLLTSEVATNAVEHPTGLLNGQQEFLISASFVPHGVMISIHDPGSATIPHPRSSGSNATGGRGLAIVNSLATRWGFHRDSTGTVIWFLLHDKA
jgi:anti-sigma regulatory factor (Ser/Thr protein kinase)